MARGHSDTHLPPLSLSDLLTPVIDTISTPISISNHVGAPAGPRSGEHGVGEWQTLSFLLFCRGRGAVVFGFFAGQFQHFLAQYQPLLAHLPEQGWVVLDEFVQGRGALLLDGKKCPVGGQRVVVQHVSAHTDMAGCNRVCELRCMDAYGCVCAHRATPMRAFGPEVSLSRTCSTDKVDKSQTLHNNTPANNIDLGSDTDLELYPAIFARLGFICEIILECVPRWVPIILQLPSAQARERACRVMQREEKQIQRKMNIVFIAGCWITH